MSNSINSSNVLRLLYSHVCFYTARNLFTLFISFFIWSETKEIQLIAVYLLVHIVAHIIAFTTFAPIVKKKNPHTPRNWSLILQVLFFFLLFLFRDQALYYLVLVGLVSGFTNGMYWISYNTLRFDLTNTKNRGNYTGSSRALTAAAGILAPVLGGALVTFNAFGIGYGNVFLLTALLNGTAIILGQVTPPAHESESYHLRKTARLVFAQSDIVKLMVGKLFGNIGYKTVLEKMLPIFIFDILANEFHVGGWISFFSVIGILATYIIGKYVDYAHYKKSMLLGGLIFSLSTLSLVGFPMLVTYLLFETAKRIFFPFMIVPQRTYTENVLHHIPDYMHHRVEYIVIREWVYVFSSRIIGYTPLLFVASLNGPSMQIILLMAGIFIILEPLILRTIKLDMNSI